VWWASQLDRRSRMPDRFSRCPAVAKSRRKPGPLTHLSSSIGSVWSQASRGSFFGVRRQELELVAQPRDHIELAVKWPVRPDRPRLGRIRFVCRGGLSALLVDTLDLTGRWVRTASGWSRYYDDRVDRTRHPLKPASGKLRDIQLH